MKLRDLGFTVLVVALLFGGFFAANKYSPDLFVAGSKVLSDVNKKYIDPLRTPGSDLDNDPVFETQ